MLTEQQEQVLRLNGWHKEFDGHWYKCRVCHNICGSYQECWSSPSYAFYHVGCVAKSAQVKKLFAKHTEQLTL